MRRIWVEKEIISEPEFELSGDPFRHAVTVSRLRLGERFQIVCGESQSYISELVSVQKKSARVRVVDHQPLIEPVAPFVHLALCLPKWSTFDSVLEKAVELGVSSIQPLVSDYSFIKSINDHTRARSERSLKIVKSATEQTGRGKLMEIHEPTSLKNFVKNFNQRSSAACLFSYEGPSQLDVKTQIQTLKKSMLTDHWLLVGSEGGFSQEEQQFISQSGFPPATLGKQILRVETACIALISIIKYELNGCS